MFILLAGIGLESKAAQGYFRTKAEAEARMLEIRFEHTEIFSLPLNKGWAALNLKGDSYNFAGFYETEDEALEYGGVAIFKDIDGSEFYPPMYRMECPFSGMAPVSKTLVNGEETGELVRYGNDANGTFGLALKIYRIAEPSALTCRDVGVPRSKFNLIKETGDLKYPYSINV